MKHKILLSVFAIVVMGVALALPVHFERSLPVVTVEQTQKVQKQAYVTASGELEAKNTSKLTVDLPVYLKALHVEVGDTVKKGDVLAQLDKTTLLAEFASQGEDAEQALGQLVSAFTSVDPSAALAAAGTGDLSDLAQKYRELPDTLVADMDGVVTLISAEEGEITGMGTPIITICSGEDMVAKIAVPEAQLPQIKEGQQAAVTSTAAPGKTYQGTVQKIYPQGRKVYSTSSQEVVVDVEIAIDNPDDSLKPGCTAKGKITVSQGTKVYAVPYDALRETDGEESLYIYQTGRAISIPVQTGEMVNGELIEITSGIEDGDFVVTNPDVISAQNALVKLDKEDSHA
ncbi:MAG TPA: efflux RND transporter periplasmic adaptor subunit [Firmicutes bacterium]|nr:efflux RND transporter periplasmic adaptor subunit [Bacillota bacterium]